MVGLVKVESQAAIESMQTRSEAKMVEEEVNIGSEKPVRLYYFIRVCL